MSIKNLIGWRMTWACLIIPLLSMAGVGCSATPVGMAMHVAGEVVNDVDAAEQSKKYVGLPASDADAKLGAPIDVFSDIHSSRVWRMYSVPMDPLNKSRYVIEVYEGKILAVYKTQGVSDPVEYAAVLAVLQPKVMGQSAVACEANLGMGPARLTVRSQNTGRLIRLYDARMVKELQTPHYCVLRFNRNDVCEQIDMVEAHTPDGGDPTQR